MCITSVPRVRIPLSPDPHAVIESIDVETIYDVPLMMEKEKLDKVVLAKLRLPTSTEANLENWKNFLFKLKHPKNEVNIGLIGKYVELPDAYKSINEAFIHAGAENECKVNLSHLSSENITSDNVKERLKDLDGVLVAPGFGDRGIEGKITTIKYLRENKIPLASESTLDVASSLINTLGLAW